MTNTDPGISVIQTKDFLDELQEPSQQPGDSRYEFSSMHSGNARAKESKDEPGQHALRTMG